MPADILRTAIRKHLSSKEDLEEYLFRSSGIELSKFHEHLYFLSVVVTMAPLPGLLGTISGMIGAFSVFNIRDAQADASTGGVGEAQIPGWYEL